MLSAWLKRCWIDANKVEVNNERHVDVQVLRVGFVWCFVRYGRLVDMAGRVVRGSHEVHILMLGEEILLNVLDRIPDRLDRQSWCLVCKDFLQVEASCRKYVHLLRNEILEPILGRYSHVEHLDLSSCVEVTDACLETVAKCAGNQLLSLKMVRTAGFSNAGMESIAKCRCLQEVDLTNCTQVGDAAVASLSVLENLQKLKLTGCRDVTDMGLSTLSNCKELRMLDLKFCSGLSDIGIGHIAKNCWKLQTVILAFTEVRGSCFFFFNW